MTTDEKPIIDFYVGPRPSAEEKREFIEYYNECCENDIAIVQIFKNSLHIIGIHKENYPHFPPLFLLNKDFPIHDFASYFFKIIRKKCPRIDKNEAIDIIFGLIEYESYSNFMHTDTHCRPPPGKLLLQTIKTAEKYKPTMAQKGAAARQKENKQAKEFMFSWLDDNIEKYKTLDEAAFAAAGKVVPYTFRTVRRWVTEWKKLRATGTG